MIDASRPYGYYIDLDDDVQSTERVICLTAVGRYLAVAQQ